MFHFEKQKLYPKLEYNYSSETHSMINIGNERCMFIKNDNVFVSLKASDYVSCALDKVRQWQIRGKLFKFRHLIH